MHFYLSSYKLGNEIEYLKALAPKGGKKTGYVPNAMDFIGVDLPRLEKEIADELAQMERLGLSMELLDLKLYFGKKEELRKKLDGLGGVWVRGGNTFVLRQAMKLSGFDEVILDSISRKDFLYGGYSAGCCVLSPGLDSLQIVDDPKNYPYPQLQETIWDGLALLPFAYIPHYDSDHHESALIESEIKRCIENKTLFKAFRDGEVYIFERNE